MLFSVQLVIQIIKKLSLLIAQMSQTWCPDKIWSTQAANHQEAVDPHLQWYAKFKFTINCEIRQYVTSGHQGVLWLLLWARVFVWNKVNRAVTCCGFSAPLGAVMWQRIQICCALFALYSAAPPAHINRLALFPDKSAWCEAKNITQIVGHTGCQPRSIQNRSGWRPSLSVSLSLCLSVCLKIRQCGWKKWIIQKCLDVNKLRPQSYASFGL